MKIHRLLIALMLLTSITAYAGEPISKSGYSGVTIGGHDTVAYHTPEAIETNKATKGSKKYIAEWGGAKWRFTSEANRDAFLVDPDNYRPAYGGYCANALSIGEGLIKTDGETWEIFEDQLYVFYAPRGRTRWNDGNWNQYKADADRAWQEIIANQ